MANWCTNHLVVKGDVNEVRRFIETGKSTDPRRKNENALFSFKGFVGVPKGETVKNYWGTNSDADVAAFDDFEGELSIRFYTEWCPPELWFHAVVKAFPNLEIQLHYYELGNEIAGYLEYCRIKGSKEQHFHEWKDVANFLYGNEFGDWGFDTVCEDCQFVEVEVKEIIAHGRPICKPCFQRRIDECGPCSFRPFPSELDCCHDNKVEVNRGETEQCLK